MNIFFQNPTVSCQTLTEVNIYCTHQGVPVPVITAQSLQHLTLSIIQYSNILRQWLFCRRRQFARGIYFAVIIHVCLYSQICYHYTSDTVV